jgi:hypothetical protein
MRALEQPVYLKVFIFFDLTFINLIGGSLKRYRLCRRVYSSYTALKNCYYRWLYVFGKGR